MEYNRTDPTWGEIAGPTFQGWMCLAYPTKNRTYLTKLSPDRCLEFVEGKVLYWNDRVDAVNRREKKVLKLSPRSLARLTAILNACRFLRGEIQSDDGEVLQIATQIQLTPPN